MERMMEHNIFDRVFEKTYGPAVMPYGCLSDAETIRMREAVQSLRQSYQPQYANEACVSRYHTCPEMYGTLNALRGAQLHDRTAITIPD